MLSNERLRKFQFIVAFRITIFKTTKMSEQNETPPPPDSLWGHSPEEQALLRTCKNEALTERALPCAAILGTATYYALKKGYIKPTENFGFWARVVVGGTTG